MAKVIQVIETEQRRGSGRDETSPIRGVMQYWSLDGELLAEVDPHGPTGRGNYGDGRVMRKWVTRDGNELWAGYEVDVRKLAPQAWHPADESLAASFGIK